MTDFSKRIAATADDVYSTASTLTDGTGVYIGDLGAGGVDTGFRFNSVTIPKGATINSAILTVRARASLSGTTCKVKIYGFDTDDSPAWDNSAGKRPTDCTKTTANTSWTLPAFTVNTNYDTPDFASVVKEIVDRDGWSSGNDMSIVFMSDSSSGGAYRDVYQGVTVGALLSVSYTVAAGPANLKTYNTNVASNIKTINTNAIANVKSLNTNT